MDRIVYVLVLGTIAALLMAAYDPAAASGRKAGAEISFNLPPGW